MIVSPSSLVISFQLSTESFLPNAIVVAITRLLISNSKFCVRHFPSSAVPWRGADFPVAQRVQTLGAAPPAQ